MAMSVYLLATAFGPLLIGPLSELYGRRVVLHTTSVWFLIWNIVCGFAHTKGLLIAARLMAGLGASAIYALGSGVLGDVWRSDERGRSLGIYSLLPLFGAAAGPIIGGYITEYTTWRWMFWSTSIFQAIMIVISIPLFRETHGPTILRHKAKELRRSTGNSRYYTEDEALGKGRSISWVLMRSFSRPIRLLLFHPIIQVQACLSAFDYGITYITLSTYSDIWTLEYHESISKSGLHYLAMCLGEIVGAQIGGPLLDLVFRRMKQRANGVEMPEFRGPDHDTIIRPHTTWTFSLWVGSSKACTLDRCRPWSFCVMFWYANWRTSIASIRYRFVSRSYGFSICCVTISAQLNCFWFSFVCAEDVSSVGAWVGK